MFSFKSFFSRRAAVRNEESGSAADSEKSVLNLPPGLMSPPLCLQYDNFAKEWQGTSQQDTFDGFRVEAGKPLTKNMQMTHTLLLGTQSRQNPYSYQFGPIFQTEDGRTFLMGKYNIEGLLNIRGVKKFFGNHVDVRVNGGSCLIEPNKNIMELSKDLNFETWATSLKLVWQGVWIMNFGFSRLITPQLHMGGELTYLTIHQGATMGTLGFRWNNSNHILSGTLGRTPDFKNPGSHANLTGVRMQYVHKVSERVSLGTELDYTYPDHESACKIGYEYTFRTSKVQGLLDTAGKVSCFVNDFKGYGLSGLIDYVNNDYRFGVLCHYFPPGPEAEGEMGMNDVFM